MRGIISTSGLIVALFGVAHGANPGIAPQPSASQLACLTWGVGPRSTESAQWKVVAASPHNDAVEEVVGDAQRQGRDCQQMTVQEMNEKNHAYEIGNYDWSGMHDAVELEDSQPTLPRISSPSTDLDLDASKELKDASSHQPTTLPRIHARQLNVCLYYDAQVIHVFDMLNRFNKHKPVASSADDMALVDLVKRTTGEWTKKALGEVIWTVLSIHQDRELAKEYYNQVEGENVPCEQASKVIFQFIERAMYVEPQKEVVCVATAEGGMNCHETGKELFCYTTPIDAPKKTCSEKKNV